MAHYSAVRYEAEERKLKAEREAAAARALAPMLMERTNLFRRFRAAGWIIQVIHPKGPADSFLPDDSRSADVHFYLKMPGAHWLRVKSITQLTRLVGGVE